MFDTIADMLRGSAPDDLAHALGTDRTQTRRAMEIGLPALITGLRDKAQEPGGAQNLASMLDEPTASLPADLDAYLAAGDPAQGAAMLDVAFGDRGEPALGALSTASGLSTRLLAQVMSVLAPLATGVLGAAADRSPDGLRSYLGAAVDDLQDKGFGRVVELVSPEATETGMLPLDVDGPDMIDSPDDIDEPDAADLSVVVGAADGDATVVEGAFGAPEDFVTLDEPDADIDFNLDVESDAQHVEIPGAMPPLVAAAPDLDADLAVGDGAVMVADQDPHTELIADIDDGAGLSKMGWLWWLIGAVLGILVLLFAISQCTGSDGEDPVDNVETGDQADATPEPPDPAVLQRQATLDAILVDYPNVQGLVIGDIAKLDGTVPTGADLATLDAAVRAAQLGVQNNVTVAEGDAVTPVGYSINDLILAQPELSQLKGLLDEAGLAQALDGNGDFTLFAPTNDAIAAADLSEVQGNADALTSLLRYHILSSVENGAAIAAMPTLTTNQGEMIEVTVQGDQVILNGSAVVIRADAPARNGVLHIIDTVLIPPSSERLPEELGVALGLAPITFGLGSADLTDAGKAEVDKVIEFLLATPGAIEIHGHTDSDGDTALNQTLSQDRADAVKTYMADSGVPADSLTAIGFGEANPIVDNDSPENKAKNRRIEFRPVS